MHNIDTVRLEAEGEEEFNYEAEGESEEESSAFEAEEEFLAAELLGVASEDEMDQFLGKLFKRVSRKLPGVGSFLRLHAGPLANTLKGIAKSALPTVGAALGTAIPIPGVGTALGGLVGDAASKLLEAETESEDSEDYEFATAKRFVRLAGNTARQGVRMPATPNRRANVLRALRSALNQLRSQRRAISRIAAAQRRLAAQRAAAYMSDGAATADSAMGGDAGAMDMAGGDLAGASDGADSLASGMPASSDQGAGTTGASAGEDESYQYESESFGPVGGSRSGRWVRRGGKIILYGL